MPTPVRPKKHLGQHFLHDARIAERITLLLQPAEGTPVIEIGPGMGVLTRHLVARGLPLTALEVDTESIAYLQQHYPSGVQVLHSDVLKHTFAPQPMAWIGNLPYNISSPILFRLLEQRQWVQQGVFMLQKEVARRIATGPGSKEYGILSVLLQYYYEVKYAFSVPPGAFTPPPKVQSGVITLQRRSQPDELPLEPLSKVVKTAFNQRRKQLVNTLKPLNLTLPAGWETRRAEELTVQEFVLLARMLHD